MDHQLMSMMLTNPFFALATIERQLNNVEASYNRRFQGLPEVPDFIPDDPSFAAFPNEVHAYSFNRRNWTKGGR